MPRRFLPVLLLLATLSGCAFVTPRFEQNVQTEFVREDMRKLSTRTLELYYPARLRPSALRIAARLEDCVERLRLLPHSPRERERVLVYLTGEDFNNAYVLPDYSSLPQQMVLPSHMSLELFNLLGFGPAELGAVGCHEAVHYVQMQQTDGLWGALNTFTGGLFQSNSLTESWFLEGLATFYEGRLGKAQGRPHSPVWHGFFEAASQELGGAFHPGYLNPAHRRMDLFGGNYLTGSHFVAWLAQKYGEDKLWRLVADQGESLLPPVGVTLRFRAVYNRTIGTLFDEFSAELARTLQVRRRPEAQRVLSPQVGYFARLAASPADGAIATVDVGRDEVPHLTVREREGGVRFRRKLTQFLPGRRWISTHPINMSGLSFTEDGQSLYLVAADLDALGSYLSRVWRVDARTGEVVRTWEGVRGMGGGVSPDGRSYVFVHVSGDTANLHRLDLLTGEHTALTRFEGQTSLGPPAVAGDGRIAFARVTEHGWNLALREVDGTVRALTEDARFNYAPRWLDAERLVFVREHEGRWQAHLLDLATGAPPARLTDAPHLVMDVAPRGPSDIVFLNREGFDFSLDSAPVEPREPGTAVATARPVFPPLEPGAPSAPFLGHDLDILSDAPYSPLERFFLPELRAPYIYALPDAANPERAVIYGGLALAGQDRLGFHQYALLVEANTALRDPSLSFTYGTALTAPWRLQLSAARLRDVGRRDLQASASLSRTFWTTPVSVRLLALRRDWFGASRYPGLRTSLVGPEASVSFSAGESSSYGGTQRALSLSLSGGVYPLAFAQARPFAEVRGELAAVVPGLPGLTRDNLLLSLVGHALPNAPAGLFQVGGVPAGAYSLRWRQGPEDSRSLPPALQPGVSFVEPLRGYEDFALEARHVLIASARYRYRVIFDYGWSSFFWLGPSFFISHLELEAFGAWARTDWRADHRAAGGAVFLRTNFGQAVPVSLFYQYARRFDDGLGHLHLLGISL
ncbi:hypothetical protein [Archangium primigenium]|uniref:hypothetical protein n=1 Tax=[Archangium] primigenium TaxID=2792470 RepID=UPI00195B96B2|nr:hypothetical protein [Archangium primigenium]MBM7117333.1 hypothetical protein [Archangium primigenium]